MCDTCEWEEQLEELNELCADNDYEWANETLSGIAEWVEEKKHITAKQMDAIGRIKAAVEDRR
ncbi:MAG: hypothetical protein WCV62_05925 [Candidatus Peribacteraceae bacterium]|jgi:hypothetical protein